jgi:hypothetical protein
MQFPQSSLQGILSSSLFEFSDSELQQEDSISHAVAFSTTCEVVEQHVLLGMKIFFNAQQQIGMVNASTSAIVFVIMPRRLYMEPFSIPISECLANKLTVR